MYKKAFTLIEVLIAISLLSIIMLYLYKSYNNLNLSNDNFKKEVHTLSNVQNIKKVFMLDVSLAIHKSINIQNKDFDKDFISFQSSNSLHKRFNPYVAYISKEEKLYRLESLKPFTSDELEADREADVDMLGEVESFRIYKSRETDKEQYLVSVKFKNMKNIFVKARVLNEY